MFLPPRPLVSLHSLREQSVGKPILLLYPWANCDAVFVQQYLVNRHSSVLYWRLPRRRPELRAWLADMVSEFVVYQPGFGANTRLMPAEGSLDQLAQALLADLESLSPQALLYLETDGALPNETFLEFIRALAQQPTSEVQIILSARMLAHAPVKALVEQGRAVVLSPVRRRQELLFTTESVLRPQLEVFAFGGGLALLDGKEIAHWDGALPRLLFYYLVDHPFATRDDIFAAFWSRSERKDATDIFHVTKHKVSDVLGRYAGSPGEYEITHYTQGLYMPDESIWRHYDVHEFERLVERAFTAADEREAELLLRRALDLYQAPYLRDTDAEWVLRRRAELASRYGDALIQMARILDRRGQLDEACDSYERALNEHPGREDVHRALIRLMLRQGYLDRAREQYRVIETYLDQQMRIKPSRETLELRDELESRSP
jgi:DNA-binding SARP family transcriptional activator